MVNIIQLWVILANYPILSSMGYNIIVILPLLEIIMTHSTESINQLV